MDNCAWMRLQSCRRPVDLFVSLLKALWVFEDPNCTFVVGKVGVQMGAWNYNIRADFAQNSPIYPQDCGSRTGVYSATVTGSIPGICFAGDSMTFSALPYTPHELENARHLYELHRDDNKTAVRGAACQRGVGGDNSWGAKPHENVCFTIEKEIRFRFALSKQI